MNRLAALTYVIETTKGWLLLLDLAYPGRLGLVNDDFDGNKSSKELVTLTCSSAAMPEILTSVTKELPPGLKTRFEGGF